MNKKKRERKRAGRQYKRLLYICLLRRIYLHLSLSLSLSLRFRLLFPHVRVRPTVTAGGGGPWIASIYCTVTCVRALCKGLQ